MKKIIEKLDTTPKQELFIKSLGLMITSLSTIYLVVYVMVVR